MFSLLIALIYLCFISLGLPDSLLGSAWPTLSSSFSLPLSYLSHISITISSGTIVSSLLSDSLSKKLGTGLLTAISIALTAVGLLGFSFVSAYWMFFLYAIPYGLGAGGVDSSLNNYVALHLKAKHMSWLHCMWGVGAFISPNIMSFALGRGNWQEGYRIVFYIQIVIACMAFFSLPLWKKATPKKEEVAVESKAPSLGIKGVIKLKGALLFFMAFFCYCALEQATFQWSASYYVGACGADKTLAATLASLVFLGMTMGRFINGFLTLKFSDKQLIFGAGTLLATGILLLSLSFSNVVVAGIAFALIGIGCGPIYPSIIHSTPGLFGKSSSQAMIGVQMAFAYTANLSMPPLFGLLADWLGISILPYFLALFLLLLYLFYGLALQKTGAN